MIIQEVKTLSVQERFVYWIKERESIRLRRKAGKPKPWTDDEILQKYRFCNVRRMDDKVSQWLLKNWYEPNKNHRNVLLACALARYINLPSSLEIIGFPKRWRPDYIKEKLRARKAEGHKIFNGAYIISTCGLRMDKLDYVIDCVLEPLHSAKLAVDSLSIFNTWKKLVQFNGFAGFMAGQVTADLRWAVDGDWKDAGVWAPIGPGSRRGMNRLLGRDIKKPIGQREFEGLLKDLIGDTRGRLPLSTESRMEAIDFQNCLCEFDKYERTLLEGRRPKQKYPGVQDA